MSRLTRMSIPIIFGQIGQMLFGVTDTVMVGRLGVSDLAASAFVNNLMGFPMITIIGFGAAISVVVSERVGQGSTKDALRTALNGTRALLIFMVIALIGGCFMYLNLERFGQPPEVVELSGSYFLWMMASLVPMTAFLGLRQFCDGIGRPSIPMIVVFASAGLNVILNGVFMFGWLGGVEWGLTGAGIATFLSRIAMFLLIVGFVFFDTRTAEFRGEQDFRGLVEPADPVFRKLGLPGAFQFLFEVGAFSGAGLIMGWFGAQALAAHQIALNVASVTFMIALGFSLAGAVLIGEARGAGDLQMARSVALSALKKILVYAAIVCAVLILARQIIPSFYTSDQDLIMAASQLLIIAGLFQFFDCTQVVLVGALRGYKDTVVPTWITLIGYWGLALPLGYWLGFPMDQGPLGVWVGLATGLGMVACSLGWRFHYVSRRGLSTS